MRFTVYGVAENAWLIATVVVPVLIVALAAMIAVRKGRVNAPRAVAGIAVVFVLAGAYLYWSYAAWTPTVPPNTEGPPADARIEMTDDIGYEPASLVIGVGDTVEWVNLGETVGHTATAEPSEAPVPEWVELPPGAEGFDSGLMPLGSTHKHTFLVPGRYVYFCQQHGEQGMLGEIIVE